MTTPNGGRAMPNQPDPDRRITPEGFHVDSPFARQYMAPQPVTKPTQTTKPETVVDMADLEEAYHRLENALDAIESAQVGNSHVGQKIATASGEFLSDELEAARNLIYRNLR